MKRLISAFAVAATALAAVAPATVARADDGGRVAAGIAGGFLGGVQAMIERLAGNEDRLALAGFG